MLEIFTLLFFHQNNFAHGKILCHNILNGNYNLLDFTLINEKENLRENLLYSSTNIKFENRKCIAIIKFKRGN